MTVAQEIRALRAALQENTTTFAQRWRCSPRTVEDWEQGRRQPNAFALDAMRALALASKPKKKHTKPGES